MPHITQVAPSKCGGSDWRYIGNNLSFSQANKALGMKYLNKGRCKDQEVLKADK
jgi:hypothetical protein